MSAARVIEIRQPAADEGRRRPSAHSMPGELLSPSQVSMYLSCAAKWAFKYLLDMPDPPGAGAVRGLAFHQIVEYWMRAKMEGVQLGLDGVADAWAYAWDAAAEGARFLVTDNIEAVSAKGLELTVKYLAEVGPSIEP